MQTFSVLKSLFPKQQVLDLSKLKQFADDDFEFDDNGMKFFKRVENTMGTGKIDLYNVLELPFLEKEIIVLMRLILSSANALNLAESEILLHVR